MKAEKEILIAKLKREISFAKKNRDKFEKDGIKAYHYWAGNVAGLQIALKLLQKE